MALAKLPRSDNRQPCIESARQSSRRNEERGMGIVPRPCSFLSAASWCTEGAKQIREVAVVPESDAKLRRAELFEIASCAA